MNLKLIACEILFREFCTAAARSVNRVDVEFLPKGLHDIGQAGMSRRLQEAVAAVDQSQYEAIVMGYALCSNGLVGLAAKNIPIVVPRAHDCITLFLGDRQRYLDYFRAHPGAYYKTSGWIERGSRLNQYRPDAIQEQTGMTMSYEKLVEKYGEDNAQFLYEQLCQTTRNYEQFTFIRMGLENEERFEQFARTEAAQSGWKFDAIEGSMSLIQGLLDGPWDDDRYLVVRPGQRIAPCYDDRIIKIESIEKAP